jgi:thiosulfate/3-mercaptopyruvate sulfurtransferase
MAWQNLVSAETAAARLKDPRLLVFDCRYDLMHPEAGRKAYATGHLPRAVYADVHRDLAVPATPRSGRHPLPGPAGFGARLRAWGVNEDSLLLVYDESSGLWASRFWWMTAKWLGHPHVAVLDGGLQHWRELQLPLTAEVAPPRPAGDFSPRVNAAAVVDADTTAQAALDPRARVLDARAPERYRGESEPIDPVAGHVPGARNHPAERSLDSNGRFLPVNQLQETFAASLAGVAPADTIAMCGSGVTACHLLLGMELAGLRGGRLYVGSWSEWSRDPARPVARGAEP